MIVTVVRLDGGWSRGPCGLRGAFFLFETDHLGGFGLEFEARRVGAIAVVDMSFEKRALRGRVERAARAFTFVEARAAEMLRDAHKQFARLVHIESGFQDRIEGLVLLVAGNRSEQFSMAELDPAFVERGFDHLGEIGERKAAIELIARPSEPPYGLGPVALARGKVADSGIRLLGLGRIVTIVVLGDRGFEGFLVRHLADDDWHFAVGAVDL